MIFSSGIYGNIYILKLKRERDIVHYIEGGRLYDIK